MPITPTLLLTLKNTNDGKGRSVIHVLKEEKDVEFHYDGGKAYPVDKNWVDGRRYSKSKNTNQ